MALKDWKFGVLLVLVVGTMVLLYMNLGLAGANREKLAEVTERQRFLSQTISLSQMSSRFIQGLARLAAETKDEDIRRVLADHGVTFTVPDQAQPDEQKGAAGAEQKR